MAITKEFSTGTIVAITARATISSGDPSLLQYSWYRDGNVISTVLTAGVSNIITSTAGTYYVVVSHPDADSVTSDTFILTLRQPQDIIRLIYHSNGTTTNSDGSFTSPVVIDWNIATQQFEFGPDVGNGFGTANSGWWRVFAKEKNVSLDITLRGSSGGQGSASGGQGGTGVFRRTFEQGQLYTFRVGDKRNVPGDDIANNGPNGGLIISGSGSRGGGCTYMKRGGTLVAVCGGGGGSSSGGLGGGDGGGFNVPGERGDGANGGDGGANGPPVTQVDFSGFPSNGLPIIMATCGLDSNRNLSCTTELGANDNQNSGAFASNGGGAGGGGVRGGSAGTSNNGGGGGGSGFAQLATVTVLSTQLGGNPPPKNGSVLIRKTGFLTYNASWFHATGTNSIFNVSNTGSFLATIIPQNEETTSTTYNNILGKHYLIKFQEPFLTTNYTIEFSFISTIIADVSATILPNMEVSFSQKELSQCRVWFTGDDISNVHVRETVFRIY